MTKRDVEEFINVLPDWHRFSERLERIMLAKGSDHCDGQCLFYHREESGAVFLHAWREDLWVDMTQQYFAAHQIIFDRLGVSYDQRKDDVLCRFTEVQARAFMLLHVFLHELGHHYDNINQKHLGSSTGEDYAERFAISRFEKLFPEYVRVFGDPSRGI